MPLHRLIDIRAVCFDWGGTLMSEVGPDSVPMGLWRTVEVVPGAAECLAALDGRAPLCVATNASVSGKPMIEKALARVGLARHFNEIFCYADLGYIKSQPQFWHAVSARLNVPLRQIAMIGDSLEQDCLAPRSFGVQAVWFNPAGRPVAADLAVPYVNDLVQFARMLVPAAGAVLRQAFASDIGEMQRVRHAVTENRLTSGVITDEQVRDAIERTGRGWVIEGDGRLVGFAVGNGETGNIWALFIEPGFEGQGYGRRLHDEMVAWLWSRGLERLWLTTEANTRAERFYRAAGWQAIGVARGELLFELRRADQGASETGIG